MPKFSLLAMFSAAHDLSNAVSNNRTPDARSLEALGITDEMAKRFKR